MCVKSDGYFMHEDSIFFLITVIIDRTVWYCEINFVLVDFDSKNDKLPRGISPVNFIITGIFHYDTSRNANLTISFYYSIHIPRLL